MKKYISIAIYYAYAALAAGVFYREFTKFNDFTGVTSLGKIHTHLFVLGMFVFLLVALFSERLDLTAHKSFQRFLYTYNIGLILMVVMLLVRGVVQVLALELSKGLNASISGLAGVGHILLAFGLMSLLYTLKKAAKN